MRKLPSNVIHDFGIRWAEDKNEYMKKYMKMYNLQKVSCCGMEICKGVIAKHRRTKRHLRKELEKQLQKKRVIYKV